VDGVAERLGDRQPAAVRVHDEVADEPGPSPEQPGGLRDCPARRDGEHEPRGAAGDVDGVVAADLDAGGPRQVVGHEYGVVECQAARLRPFGRYPAELARGDAEVEVSGPVEPDVPETSST
jgi:hypothetical protein